MEAVNQENIFSFPSSYVDSATTEMFEAQFALLSVAAFDWFWQQLRPGASYCVWLQSARLSVLHFQIVEL